MLGSSLVPKLTLENHDVLTVSRSASTDYQLDLVDRLPVESLMSIVKPDIIINLAAATNVDECERNPNHAYLQNVKSVENIVSGIQRSHGLCQLIHISTDQVYDGSGPHLEENISLINYYAFSKYMAEIAAQAVPNCILRTNFFGRSKCPSRTSISDWIVKELLREQPIKVFEDVFFSPLTIDSLCSYIIQIISRQVSGTYNLGSIDGTSKAQFAFLLADTLGLNTDKMTFESVAAMEFPAARPKDMRMNSARFEEALGVSLPTLESEILSMRTEYVDLL